MNFTTLISVDGLAQFLNEPNWVIIDCRFWLDDANKGRLDYQEGHIPGAIYAHLDEDLSGPVVPGETGRHPLPEVDSFTQKLGVWGIGPELQVIVYDDRGGMIAARLWWMLRWLGHENVALLDGGYPAWVDAEQLITTEVPFPEPRSFKINLQPELVFSADDILSHFGDPGSLLLDFSQSGAVPRRGRTD